VLSTTGIRGVGRSLRLLAVGISDELRRLLGHVGLQLPPIYLRLVAPITDPKALALLPLQVCVLCHMSNGLMHGVCGAGVCSILWSVSSECVWARYRRCTQLSC
jgi:hypothetical protein